MPRNVLMPTAGSLLVPTPIVGEPVARRPVTMDECPQGGSHSFALWSAKMRCTKCGYTQG